ncbi:bacillithiol system redox-active protein YtxJ [Wenyingzhuangia sp. chi5]|uniref:Bacillithiol system redox-active protein YtxJ n=1 Tax=Wenyingzhuangia gilva TaxID=3057677 RepID=A0ABT8VU72_9FLAO|nr:bacillithiol system redox-active protein YtxJ [Wenyingzhuangia sp. chi5]MDO3695503.1 bacillithiol system redox-active protein YtxJ [Wenyingzhuangia sp. chi5]
MGLLDSFLGKNKEENKDAKVNWIPLTDISQLDDVVKASKNNKVVIFKHSTRCSISASVLNKFEKKIGDSYQLYFLDLISYRDISNAIADKFNVVHQSPQAIFLENEKVVQHDSHYGILDLTF